MLNLFNPILVRKQVGAELCQAYDKLEASA